MEAKKRRLIRNYFSPFPGWAGWLVLASLGLMWMSGWGVWSLWVGGLPLGLGLTVVGLWLHRPSDTQIDAWIEEDLVGLEPRALAKSFLIPKQQRRNPVRIIGPRLRWTGGVEFAIKRGADRKIRFNPLNVVIINFTNDHLTIYRTAFDLTTGKALNEETHEYFYNDVVNVATQARAVTLEKHQLSRRFLKALEVSGEEFVNGKIQIEEGEEFVLTTSGGTSVRILLRAPLLIRAAGGGEIPTGPTDRAVQASRKMIRERKKAA